MKRLLACGCLGLALTVPTPVSAEVAVITQDDLVRVTYVIRTIVDDSEPVGTAWIRFQPDGPGKVILNDNGHANGDGHPTLLLDPTAELAAAAWAKNSPTGYDVVISSFTAGAWSAPLVVGGSPFDDLDPQLVQDQPGDAVHLVYWKNSVTPGLMHRKATADLSAWGPGVQLSGPAEVAVRPGACVHDGLLRIAYEVHTGGYGTTPRQIVLATVGETVTTEVIAITNHDGPNRPQIHSDGIRMWIDWIDSDDEMAWTVQNGAGAWLLPQSETFNSVEERDYLVRGAIQALAIN